MKWRYRDVWVHYGPELDGGGTTLARPFLAYLRRAGRQHYRRCFEWCSGPGFIGVVAALQADHARRIRSVTTEDTRVALV